MMDTDEPKEIARFSTTRHYQLYPKVSPEYGHDRVSVHAKVGNSTARFVLHRIKPDDARYGYLLRIVIDRGATPEIYQNKQAWVVLYGKDDLIEFEFWFWFLFR